MNRQELISNIKNKKSFLCVGLDTDVKKIPQHLLTAEDPIFEFNKAIIDATAPFTVAYKPNVAFYECSGVAGWVSLEKTVSYIKDKYPDIFIIADAKRGDIGNTSKMYARCFFEQLDVDALTVAPYMNKGSHDFQLIEDEKGTPLFETVMRKTLAWGSNDNIMFVVGATQGRMFETVRRIVPDTFLLVPGVGAQGGSLEEVAKYGMTAECGLLVNSSRGIIYASQGEDFAEVAAQKAEELQRGMEALLRDKKII